MILVELGCLGPLQNFCSDAKCRVFASLIAKLLAAEKWGFTPSSQRFNLHMKCANICDVCTGNR